jgi:hypothetical protein
MAEPEDYVNDDIIFGTNWEAMRRAISGQDLVESGMQVTIQSPPTMTLDVASGVFYENGTRRVYAGGTVVIGAASANPRWDAVFIDSTNVVQVSQGTPHATNPKLNDLDDGDVFLAQVLINPSDIALPEAQVLQFEFRSPEYITPPPDHNTSHENGGSDEIDVVGLSGLLGDEQTPLVHGHDKTQDFDSCLATEGDDTQGGQSIPDSTWTDVELDDEIFDSNTMHDNVTNNHRITAKRTGYYLAVGQIVWSPNATGERGLRLLTNGTNPRYRTYDAGTNSHLGQRIVAVVYLTASQYVSMQAWQNSGGALALNITGTGSEAAHEHFMSLTLLPNP